MGDPRDVAPVTEAVELCASFLGALPLKLTVTAGPDAGREVALSGPLDVGTDPSCVLALHDAAISRKHLAVIPSGGRVMIRDLGSRNGTRFGGARIKEIELPLGATVRLGHTDLTLQTRWHIRDVAPSQGRSFGELFGESAAMRALFAILGQVALSEVPVLVQGESGSGKGVAARSLHRASARREAPYVVFDCRALPATLAEGALFGDADGTGAFGRAEGGILCLDEVGELAPELQLKVLRVLESGEIASLGATTPRKLDVRIVASTNRDLLAESKRGQFRSDLYYRLGVVRVRMPPLRHRPEDVPGLVATLLEGKLAPTDRIAGSNLQKLVGYSWPGNVRELRTVVAKASARTPNATFENLVFDLGPMPAGPSTIGAESPGVASHIPYGEAREQLLDAFTRNYIASLMDRHGSDVAGAASAAGLSEDELGELIRNVR